MVHKTTRRTLRSFYNGVFRLVRFFSLLLTTSDSCEHITGHGYCPKCGKQLRAESLDFQSYFVDFSAFWLRRGFRQTVIGLFLSPAKNLNAYLCNDRQTLVRPLLYLSFTSVFAFWAIDTAGVLGQCTTPETQLCSIVSDNPFLVQFLQAIVFAMTFRYIFFPEMEWNIYEISAVMTFLLSQGLVITGAIVLLCWNLRLNLALEFSAALRLIYHFSVLVCFLGADTWTKMLRVFSAIAVSIAIVFAIVFIFEFVFEAA